MYLTLIIKVDTNFFFAILKNNCSSGKKTIFNNRFFIL